MAKVLGESGRYVSNQAIEKFQSMMKIIVATISILAALGGLSIGLAIRGANLPFWFSTVLNGVILLVICFIWKWTNQRLEVLEKQREHMRRGASGETAVAYALANFPDDYHVINDLTTPFGNLDHVVIGPTGVFVLDTKNWRGLVSSDGKGELLLNGTPTDKPMTRRFVGRIMGIKEKVRVLAPGLDPFFQSIFVFTAARVEASWGSTGNVHCIRDDQLFEYITDTKFRKELKPHEIKQIAQAFLGLAHMDKDFSAKSVSSPHNAEFQTA